MKFKDISIVDADTTRPKGGEQFKNKEDFHINDDDVVDDGDDDDDDGNVRREAKMLVDKVLEESVSIIHGQQQHAEFLLLQQQEEEQQLNGFDPLKQDYYNNSESENYAITCDDIDGLDVVKSPTIESMSGKSFDDNMSFTDEHSAQTQSVTTATTIVGGVLTTTTTTTTTVDTISMTSSGVEATAATSTEQHQQHQQQRAIPTAELLTTTTTTTATATAATTTTTTSAKSSVASVSLEYSVGGTSATASKSQEAGGEFAKPPTATATTAPNELTTTTAQDMPTPKPRSVIASSLPLETLLDAPMALVQQDDAVLDASAPVPKPRSQMKPSDSFKNLTASAEQSDSVSLRSFELTEELSRTEEPSTELSTRSQQREFPAAAATTSTTTTTTVTTATTVSEDRTESFEPTSEISVDDADTEISEAVGVAGGDGKTTSFYIGESSHNVITKTTPTKPEDDDLPERAFDDINTAVTTIEATDIALMQEISVDSDESVDVFKEFITLKRDSDGSEGKIVRQDSETRNDLLEIEAALLAESKDIARETVVTAMTDESSYRKTSAEQSITRNTITSTTSTGSALHDVAHSMGEDDSIKEISEKMSMSADKFELQLEKGEWEMSEKQMPQDKSKVVHSPLLPVGPTSKEPVPEAIVLKTLDEVKESLEAAKTELQYVVKDGTEITESPSEFEFRAVPQAVLQEPKTTTVEHETDALDISSFIGVPEASPTATRKSVELIKQTESLFEGSTKETLNREAVSAHYAQNVFGFANTDSKDEHGSLGFVSTGTAEDYSSIEEHAAKEEHASLGFISTETAEDFSSMEDYYQEKMAKASVVSELEKTEGTSAQITATSGSFEEFSSEQTMKPFDVVIHRVKTESSSNTTNRWSGPEIDNSSSSESYYKSFEKTGSRPLSSDLENLLTQGTFSEYQTAMDVSSTFRDTGTEYVSAVSTFESSSGKTISSRDSMKSLDSQSETSANLGSIDVSELSETLVASSTEPDALEAEEMARIRDLHADDDDSEESLEMQASGYPMTEQQKQQSSMKRSQEMIFKPKTEETKAEILNIETATVEEFPKPKEVERTWGLAYPMEELKVEEAREEDILFYHGDMRRSIDESKLASSLDEGSILSVSMSSTSNVETVVENFEDMIGSAGSSSLTGIEGFGYAHDEPASSLPEDTFVMEIESKDQSLQESTTTTPPDETRKRGHKRSESTAIAGDVLKSLTDKELPPVGEIKESESESDTDPYESEYARQFRSPTERKHKKKKAAAAEMDHSFETEKRPFTPSQLVAEVIVEDSATEELEAEAAMIEERRPSQNMHDYSNIPDITVTEDTQRSPIAEEEDDKFEEKTLYKVKTQEQLHKAADEPLHQQARKAAEEESFQKLVQEQYKQKLAEIQRAQVGDPDYDDLKAPDSPDSFEMVDQPDISEEFVIIEEVAKEAGEVDLGGKSIKIQPTKYEETHDEDVEKIIVKSAPADPKLGSQIYRDDLNFEFEESPPTAGSGSEQQDESDSGDGGAANKRWVEMQITDTQLRYPYEITGGVLEDIKEEDGECEIGSSRISSFKDSFSSTPEYARRYYAREHDDVSMSSLQEFESLEQAISLENRNKTHQGSTDSSNGSFTRRYVVRHSGSGTAQGDDISVSSLKEFEGLENACMEAHLIEIKAKEEAALLLSRSDESNKSNGSGSENGASNVVVTKVTRTVTRTEITPGQQSIEAILKQKMGECEDKRVGPLKITEISTERPETRTKIETQDSEKGSVDSLEINKSLDVMTSSIDSFDISKDATTRSDVDSLEVDRKQPTREESIDSIENEQMHLMSKFVVGGGTLGDGLTTTTTTTTTSTDADGHEHTVTRTVTTTTVSGGATLLDLPTALDQMPKDASAESLNMCIEQTTSSAGTTATYQTSAGNSQMSGSVTSCASSTLMEDSYPTAAAMSTAAGAAMTTSGYWTQQEKNAVEITGGEDTDAALRQRYGQPQQQPQQPQEQQQQQQEPQQPKQQ